MKRAGGRNGAVLAEQIYKVFPDEKLAAQFKDKLMKEYDQQGLAFKMNAYRYAHNILGETLQFMLKDSEKPFEEYVKERKEHKALDEKFDSHQASFLLGQNLKKQKLDAVRQREFKEANRVTNSPTEINKAPHNPYK